MKNRKKAWLDGFFGAETQAAAAKFKANLAKKASTSVPKM